MSPRKKPLRSAKPATARSKGLLWDGELAAMKETLKGRKMAANKEEAALAAIAAMKEPDRSMA